jgi:hypothetical protein
MLSDKTKLSREWSKFNPEEGYEKAMQDVKLKNGDIIYGCWPNGGVWMICYKQPTPKYNDEKYHKAPWISVRETDEVKLHESEILI